MSRADRLATERTVAAGSRASTEALLDALHTLERLRDLTPARANAHDTADFHGSIQAIASAALDRLTPALSQQERGHE